jgi:large subunit ribosomal protein L22
MFASLRSVRIAPKKANLIAEIVRGKTVREALADLELVNKKGARILHGLIKSAAANATNNEKQNVDDLYIKELIVNKAQNMSRGIPMARGRMRRIRKFFSHISVRFGVK